MVFYRLNLIDETHPFYRPDLKTIKEILMRYEPCTVIQGDNYLAMKEMDSESIDTMYGDPPFNSKRDYSAPCGTPAVGTAFDDLWTLDDIKREMHGILGRTHPELNQALAAAEKTHSRSMRAYLIMMALRLIEMHRILKKDGTLLLHCDSTAAHYLKIILDGIFGSRNFRNEIVWHRHQGNKNTKKNLARNTDTIFRYTKSNKYTFNKSAIMNGYSEEDIEKYYYYVEPETGRRYATSPLHNLYKKNVPGKTFEYRGIYETWIRDREELEQMERDGLIVQQKHDSIPRYKKYLDESEGKALDNIWSDIQNQNKQGKTENQGYPTQKPLSLLTRFIEMCSNPGDWILDPFCGSGSTLIAAQSTGRKWIGIDISPKTIDFVEKRLESDLEFHGQVHYIRKSLDTQDHSEAREILNRKTEKQIWTNVKTNKPKRTNIPREQEREYLMELYGKQQGRCYEKNCNSFFHIWQATIDHIVPLSKGGTHDLENLVLLCGYCNSVKGKNDMAYLSARNKERKKMLGELARR